MWDIKPAHDEQKLSNSLRSVANVIKRSYEARR